MNIIYKGEGKQTENERKDGVIIIKRKANEENNKKQRKGEVDR